MMSASFDALLSHCERRRRFRRQMRKLLETRAQNLLYRSWKFGLKRHWTVCCNRRRVKLGALKHNDLRTMRPCFRALKRLRHMKVVCVRQQKVKSVEALEMRTFISWMTVYNRLQVEKKIVEGKRVNMLECILL